MTVKTAYTKYQVPPNLAEHMLRVTGLAKIIADSWQTKNLDVETIINACLVHDMGNLLKFNLISPNVTKFMGSEGQNIDHWKKVKEEMIQKYDPDEHHATATICTELTLNEKSFWIVTN